MFRNRVEQVENRFRETKLVVPERTETVAQARFVLLLLKEIIFISQAYKNTPHEPPCVMFKSHDIYESEGFSLQIKSPFCLKSSAKIEGLLPKKNESHLFDRLACVVRMAKKQRKTSSCVAHAIQRKRRVASCLHGTLNFVL